MKISAISYLNTAPYIFGLQKYAPAQQWEILYNTPAECAHNLKNGLADIGIVPLAFTLQLPNSYQQTNYGIAADGAVHSVFLLSNTPIRSVRTILTDYQSYTSNALCKILCKELWDIQANFVARQNDNIVLQDGEAMVLIGDRTFNETHKFKYVYDLSASWKELTNLPFVFAVWCSPEALSTEQIDALNTAFDYGVSHIPSIIKELPKDKYGGFDYGKYLTTYIQYRLTDKMHQGKELFLKKLLSIV